MILDITISRRVFVFRKASASLVDVESLAVRSILKHLSNYRWSGFTNLSTFSWFSCSSLG